MTERINKAQVTLAQAQRTRLAPVGGWLDWSLPFLQNYKLMFKEYEVIKSTHNISGKVPKDCVGTVLIVHQSQPIAYEVEFVDEKGNTLEILTVFERDIKESQT